MTVNYTTNLSLGQPVTGTESGTWGDDVNNSVTSYLDIAIAGGLAITITTTDVTLTLTQGTSSATNIGSTTAQYAILNVSGAMTAARNLILPSSSRQYVINNNTTGGFALTVKGSATSGVTMVNGEKAHVFWNGSDYAKLSNTPGGAGTFSSITNTGLTSGRVVYSTTGGLETDSAGLTFDGTNFATTGTATAAKLIPTGTSVTGNGMYLPATNSVGISTAGTNAVYIDASQNVGIGVSSPNQKLDMVGNIQMRTSGVFNLNNSDNTNQFYFQNTGATGASNANLLFSKTNYGEVMRIDTSGNLLVGTTNASPSAGNGFKITSTGRAYSVITTADSDSYNLYNTTAGAYRFFVTAAGVVNATTTTITAISDQRLKENVRDIDTGLDTIMALKPRRFDWKEGKGQDKKNVAGFIAQEFEEVFPESVGVSKAGEDGIEYKNINHETLIPTLVKAIQEQQALITSLTARIEALESKV